MGMGCGFFNFHRMGWVENSLPATIGDENSDFSTKSPTLLRSGFRKTTALEGGFEPGYLCILYII